MKLFLLLVSLFFVSGSAYKILGISPFGSKSHYAIMEATLKALHEAGHEVTMISIFELKKPLKNYTQIKITDHMESMDGLSKSLIMLIKFDNKKKFLFNFTDGAFNVFEFSKMNPMLVIGFVLSMGYDTAEHLMKSADVQQLMKSNEKFDAVIVELFATDALLGFGQHFNCPVIGQHV